MLQTPSETSSSEDLPALPAPAAVSRHGSRRLIPRIGIGSRLTLGLAAVTAVILIGHALATRTTRQASVAVQRMQTESEPLAQRANAVLERLVAYDRSVSEYLQAGRSSDFNTIVTSGNALETAVAAYYDSVPAAAVTPAAAELRTQLGKHIENGARLAKSATQRAQWVDERNAALDRVYHYVSTAGGAGLAINGTQVVAQRSLAELEVAISAVRGNFASGPAMGRKEEEFTAVLSAHAAELQRSPGKAWLDLVHEDFATATRLRLAIERFDAANGPARHELLEESATLTAGVEGRLQVPARQGLLQAAEHAASSAEIAEHTLTLTGVAVLAVVLLVSVALALSISLPVRRLTLAIRSMASGKRDARAPRGGSAEIDELAESFNTMADHISRAEDELRANQAELEKRVAERTRQLQYLAYHDPLTQLPNRRQLAARLPNALARAATDGRRIALLFVDVDNFKSVNDTLGHNFGDRVLQGIAKRLQAAAGSNSLLARLGGDEFTILFEDVSSLEEVESRAAAIVTALQYPLTVDGRALSTGASVGAALYPDHAEDAEGLLRAADVAVFRAKELGRNRFAIYRAAMYDAAAQRFRLEQSLRKAVENGDLLLMFQPLVALHTMETIGLEALLRWRKPDGRIASAGEFIPIAEKTGLIHELTDWVLRSATSTVAAWRAQGWHRACVAINVSPPQFLESDFVDRIARALEVTDLPANALELEITETVFQTGANTVESLRRLRDLGVVIALDDFGTGYSSLTSLEQLPLDRVKLDRMLIEGIDTNPRSAAIVRSIVALCHGLGLQVVAEGVERSSQLEMLSHCGPLAVQGYLLAYPVEADQAEAESRVAAARAKAALEAAAMAPRADIGNRSLVFISPGSNRKKSS